jgi:hypothetical protein
MMNLSDPALAAMMAQTQQMAEEQARQRMQQQQQQGGGVSQAGTFSGGSWDTSGGADMSGAGAGMGFA